MMLPFQLGEPSSMSFSTSYRCYSVSFSPGNFREDLEKGGKIIMPPSALEILTRLNIQYPMIFKLTNKQASRSTHCGVLEFVADEGNIYVPYWMLRNLLLEEGDRVFITNTALPVATFAKFQPQTTDFLDITNPKAVLESALRNFACLTKGDIVAIQYNQKVYELKVLETKPKEAVTIIECDMHVDFEAPVGYKDPSMSGSRGAQQSKAGQDEEDDHIRIPEHVQRFQAFRGAGSRLDGKQKRDTEVTETDLCKAATAEGQQRGIPNYDYEPGELIFFRKKRGDTVESTETNFQPFVGQGKQLKPSSKHRGA